MLQGACRSGVQTITEDAPDLESTRLMHSLLLEEYTTQELVISSGFNGHNMLITGCTYWRNGDYSRTSILLLCHKRLVRSRCEYDRRYHVTMLLQEPRTEVDAWTDPHSAKNIRINGVFSLMPEFTKAFSCKAGDPMFVEERTSCYVFGPNSWRKNLVNRICHSPSIKNFFKL